MLKTKTDFSKPFECLRYGRMSSEQQNPRSPDQQFDDVDHTIRRNRLPWRIIGTYRDDAISGRYLGRRPGFQKMLRDIRTGRVRPDAILVDSLERFGRADEIPAIRRELLVKHGVLLLTADSNFADPTTQAGKALGFVEQVRSTAVNEVKAHEVFRGKRDLAMRKRWPGGPPPFGKRLRRCTESDGGREVAFSVLEDDPDSIWIVVKLLRLAKDTGWGQTRLAKALNADPQVPQKFKPFHEATVGYILTNPIYVGDLLWAEHCQGVVDDVRVVQKNAPQDMVLVPGFCEPVFPRADFDEIQAVRRERAARLRAAVEAAARARGDADGESDPRPDLKSGGGTRDGVGGAKHVRAQSPGLTLKYLLTGLVHCGECNARMVPTSSKGASRSGRKLAYYRCPLRVSGACRNARYVREDRLRAAVLGRVRARLFPPPRVAADGQSLVVAPPWLAELVDDVRGELRRLAEAAPDRRPGLREQVWRLEGQMAGWLQSLGNRDLPAVLRQGLEAQYAAAAEEMSGLRRTLELLDDGGRQAERVLDVKAALERLRRLDQVLAGGNVTAGNLELSLHVDRIEAHADGRVRMRTSRLGLFEGAVEMLRRDAGGEAGSAGAGDAGAESGSDAESESDAGDVGAPGGGASPAYRVTSRRRTKLRLDDPEYEASLGDADRAASGDAARFAGLDPAWFWDEPLEMAAESCWSATHAPEVAARRAEDPHAWPLVRLAAHFGVSVPTVRKALRIAAGREQALVPGQAADQAPGQAAPTPRPGDSLEPDRSANPAEAMRPGPGGGGADGKSAA